MRGGRRKATRVAPAPARDHVERQVLGVDAATSSPPGTKQPSATSRAEAMWRPRLAGYHSEARTGLGSPLAICDSAPCGLERASARLHPLAPLRRAPNTDRPCRRADEVLSET